MSTKLLSIVIPVYNSSKTIDALFETIDFSYSDDFEILVIDDGSLDNLKDKIIAWQQLHPGCIEYIHKQNGNWGSVLNMAFARVKGHFIKIIDADDTFNKHYFSQYMRLLKEMRSKSIDLIINSFVFFFEVDHKTSKNYFPKSGNKVKYISFDDIHTSKLLSHHALTLTKTLIANFYKLPEHIYYTDTYLILQCIIYAQNIALLPRKLFLYEYHIGVTSQSVSIERFVKNFKQIQLVYHTLTNHKLPSIMSRGRRRLILNSIKSFFYLIVTVVSVDKSLFMWQRKLQINRELSYLKPIMDDKEFKQMANSGFMFIIKYLPTSIGIRLDQFVFKTLRIGFLGAIKHTKKTRKSKRRIKKNN